MRYYFDREENLLKAGSTSYLRLYDVMDSFVGYYEDARMFLYETAYNKVDMAEEMHNMNNINSDWKHYMHCLSLVNPNHQFDMTLNLVD